MNKHYGKTLVVLILALVVCLVMLILPRANRQPKSRSNPPVATTPIDDGYWINLNRGRSDVFRKQLATAPQIVVVRESHYSFNPTNGIGMHYGWLDGKMANLYVSFSELVGYAYGGNRARTEFPDQWNHGHLTNKFDVIVTVSTHPQDALQAEAQNFLRQRFGLVWHRTTRDTDVLVLRVKHRAVLQSKITTDFAQSVGIRELVSNFENFFSKPVLDETQATDRYEKKLELVPARWIDDRTTDISANNLFLAGFGLELSEATRPQEWLVLDKVN